MHKSLSIEHKNIIMKKFILSLVGLLVLAVSCTSNYYEEPSIETYEPEITNIKPMFSQNGASNEFLTNDSLISQAHYKRGEHRIEHGEYEKGIDDFIVALSINKNIYAYMSLVCLPEDLKDIILEKLTEQFNMHPDESKWPYYIGKVYFHKHNYDEAIIAFNHAYQINYEEKYLRMIDDCYRHISQDYYNKDE